MDIFIDTADIGEIKEAVSWGIIDGVTTNPTLVSRTGKTFEQVVGEVIKVVDGPISFEAVSTKAPQIIKEAKRLSAIHPNVVVKIPVTEEGIKAVKTLSEQGIKTNVTLCFSPLQALVAAKAGATYISPFVGRLDDISTEGMEFVGDIVHIYETYGYATQVIVASVRHPIHVLEAARLGAHIATVPFKVLKQMFAHPLTDIGIKRFLDDWKKVQAAKKPKK